MSTPASTLATVLAVAVPVAAQASPAALTDDYVRGLVTRPECGGIDARTPEGAALRDRMVAKFRAESGLNPFAIRVEDEGRGIMTIASKQDAVVEATRRLARGQTLGLGLGQITGVKNLLADFGAASLAEAVRLAFDDCANVRASVRHYAGNLAHVMRVMDCASGAYNAGRLTCDTAYVRSVRALQAALPHQAAPVPANGAASAPSAAPSPPRSEGLHDAVHVHRPATVPPSPSTKEHTTYEASLSP